MVVITLDDRMEVKGKRRGILLRVETEGGSSGNGQPICWQRKRSPSELTASRVHSHEKKPC